MQDLPEWLYSYLIKLPKSEMIEVMTNALSMMESYNGSTITYCVASSIEGILCVENLDGSITYTLPKSIQVEKSS